MAMAVAVVAVLVLLVRVDVVILVGEIERAVVLLERQVGKRNISRLQGPRLGGLQEA